MSTATYTPGHTQNAIDFMLRRSFNSHGQFFVPYLSSGLTVLDCGCGPGSMTLGIAGRVRPGEVVGVDCAPSQIAQASARAGKWLRNVLSFQVADSYSLPFATQSFDRVFSHALLEHLSDPVRALREMYRVLKTGGLVGVCSPDWGTSVLSPPTPEILSAVSTYRELQGKNGGDTEAGRKLGMHCVAAGFEVIEMSARYECYPSPELIGEYLALQLQHAGESGAAAAFREWSRTADLFAQTWVFAIGRKDGNGI